MYGPRVGTHRLGYVLRCWDGCGASGWGMSCGVGTGVEPQAAAPPLSAFVTPRVSAPLAMSRPAPLASQWRPLCLVPRPAI